MSEPIALRECLDRWAHGALRGELDHVRDSVAGTRNTTLNRAAFRLGQLCATGHLDPHETTELLLAAALHTGLTEHEARATITSGLHAGHHHPRTNLPAR